MSKGAETSTREETSAAAGSIELVSLVVVAYNETEYLPGLLEDIVAQDFIHNKIELLLVDSNNGANVEQRRQMEDFASGEHGFRRVVVLGNHKGYLPHGCNVALAAYEGDAFVRIDAHARIPADFIRRTVEVLEEGHDVCGGLRPVILKNPDGWGETLLAAEASAFGASPARYRREQQGSQVASVFHGAYRREVFAVVGNYDERLLRTEDNDLSQRIREAGYHIWMDPRICSQQYLRPNLKALLRQKTANGHWIGRTLWLKPKAVSLMHLVPLVFVLALLLGVVLGFALSWLPLLFLCGVYVLADLALSVVAIVGSEKARPQMLVLPLVFLAMHIGYGCGTIVGLVRGIFSRSSKEASPQSSKG